MEANYKEKDFLFYDVICHTLLSLYMCLAYSERNISVKSRSDLILKRLKSYSKLQKYKPVKADIRRLIHFGRVNGVALEAKMIEIHALSEKLSIPVVEGSDLSRFQVCLEQLNNICEIDVEDDNKSKIISKNVLYLNRKEVLSAFDRRGKLLTPIKVYIPSDKWVPALNFCQNSGWCLTNSKPHKDTHLVGELSCSV